MRRVAAFAFFVLLGLALCLGLAFLLGQVRAFADNSFLGLTLNTILAIVIAVPVADLARKRVFGPSSFGERS